MIVWHSASAKLLGLAAEWDSTAAVARIVEDTRSNNLLIEGGILVELQEE